MAGVTIGFPERECTAITGPSGSDRSALMQCVAGLDRLTSGSAFVGDTDLSGLSKTEHLFLSKPWSEEYAGGSPEAERAQFEALVAGVLAVQVKAQRQAGRQGGPDGLDRAFHAKSTLCADDAVLQFLDLPADLRAGFAQPGASYRTAVRFSNAAGTRQPDHAPDMRGVALRVAADGTPHDLLMTNYPVSHARNAHQFVAFAEATAGGTGSRVSGVARLAVAFGPRETLRMLRNVTAARRRPVSSVATETYWGRGAMRWGPTLAVRLLLRPVADTVSGPAPSTTDPAYLSHEAAQRLAAGDVRFELCVQRYVDAASTPIEDTGVEWSERASPPEPVAVLTLPARDTTTVEAQGRAAAIDALAFNINPWNTTDIFRPLGNLNRARKAAYDASAAHRAERR